MEQKSKNSQRKQLGKQLTNLIETNDIKKIDELLSVETNIKILRENRFICPYIISIKTNNLHLFDYFNTKGFKLRGKVRKQSQSDNENQKPLTTSQSYSKALIEAVKCSNIDAVDLLIKLDINVNSSNYKYVPLQIAYNIYSIEKEKQLVNRNSNSRRLEVSSFETKSLKTLEAS